MAHIRFTSLAKFPGCTLVKGNADSFPVIISSKLKVDLITLQYMIELAATCKASSLKTYAQHLSDFLSQIEVGNEGLEYGDDGYFAWDDVDDYWLQQYSKELIERASANKHNGSNYASQVIGSVIRYLYWAEQKGFTSFQIGLGEEFRIRMTDSKKHHALSHPLCKTLSKDITPPKIAPQRSWIEIVKTHPRMSGQAITVRYERMIDWGVGVGLRAHEICALEIGQMPRRDTVENAILDSRSVPFNLSVTKGDKNATVPVSPYLLKQTWDFIDNERATIINQFKSEARKNRLPFKDSEAIFPSLTTGRALNPKSFSNQVRNSWLNAVKCGLLTEDEYVWLHGLRHVFVTDVLRALDKKGLKQPERIAKHLSRHAHVETLERYSTARFMEIDDG